MRILSQLNKDYPLELELIETDGENRVYCEIEDVYKGEDKFTNKEIVFIHIKNY